MNSPQKAKTHRAYVCYSIVAGFFAAGDFVDFINRSPSPGVFASFQVIGMVVLVPLAILSIVAGVLGGLLSAQLAGRWSREWGLVILPLVLLASVVVFAIEEQRSEPFHWLTYVMRAYILLSIIFVSRWLIVGRKHA